METIIHLTKAMFSAKEHVLVEHGGLIASTFQFELWRTGSPDQKFTW